MHKLTKSFCDQIVCPEGKERLFVWDTELRGFALCVMPSGVKAFFAQRDMPGKRTKRIKIDRYGVLTAEQARNAARNLIHDMNNGVDPVARKRALGELGVTLQTAIEMHCARMKAKKGSPRVIGEFVPTMARYFSDWLKQPLRDISREEVRRRHAGITASRGPYAANLALRYFSAAYNTAARSHSLPAQPTYAVDWNEERRRQSPIPRNRLPKWREQIEGLSPVRRDYYYFVLFTGLRRRDAASVRWEDVDFAKQTLHRPNPKGGPDRAFTIPLSRPCMRILERRREKNTSLFENYGGDAGWVFPTLSRDAPQVVIPLQEPKQKGLPSPHRLRDTYTTACNDARLSAFDIDVLTNHRPAKGSVVAGYINSDIEHLRVCQDRVSALIVSALTGAVRRTEDQV